MDPTTLDSYAQHAADSLALIDVATIDAGVSFTVEQIITEAGQVVGHYHLVLGNGSASVMPGAADNPDITIKQEAETAQALREGTLHAQGAFLTGKLSVDGDIAKLLSHGPLLSGLLAG